MTHPFTIVVGAGATAVGAVAAVFARIDPAVIVACGALVTAFGAYVSPWLLARQSTAAKVAAQAADWERQDEVAARAREDAAALLAATTAAAAAAVTHVTEQRERDAQASRERDQIHELVNSGLTMAYESDLQGRLDGRAGLLEAAAQARAQGREPTEQAKDRLAVVEAKIRELEATLAERAVRTAAADELVEATKDTATEAEHTPEMNGDAIGDGGP